MGEYRLQKNEAEGVVILSGGLQSAGKLQVRLFRLF